MSNKTWRAAGRVLKYTAIAFVFFVCALLVWRIASSGDPKSVKTLVCTEATRNAYAAEGNDLLIYRQEQNTLTRGEDNYGYFGVTQADIIPGANQIQVVFRYNNSTLKKIAEDLGLASVPNRMEDIFDVTLAVSTDLTPDNDSDNAYNAEEHPGSVRETRYYADGCAVSDTKNVYNYRKFVFENVTVDEDLTLAVYVDIYYKGNGTVPDYSTAPLGTLIIYDYKSEIIVRKLTSADKNALEG